MIRNSNKNCYGDSLTSTTGLHGTDIASQRIDDLDRACLTFALDPNHTSYHALDLGAQSIRLASLGWNVDCIDLLDQASTIHKLNEIMPTGKITYHTVDARVFNYEQHCSQLEIVFSQRFIQYLTYPEALACLSKIRKCVTANCQLYLSAGGLASELSQGYTAADKPLSSRFAPLAPALAEKHCIHAPLCLYSIEDLTTLATESGFFPVKVWNSEFGNVKGIFKNRR